MPGFGIQDFQTVGLPLALAYLVNPILVSLLPNYLEIFFQAECNMMTLEHHIQPFPNFTNCSRLANPEENGVCWESGRGKLAALGACGV